MIKELIFKLGAARNLIKVYHRACGGHVGYVADTGKSKRDTDNFYFLDGSHPVPMNIISIPCGKCKKTINNMGGLVLINAPFCDA